MSEKKKLKSTKTIDLISSKNVLFGVFYSISPYEHAFSSTINHRLKKKVSWENILEKIYGEEEFRVTRFSLKCPFSFVNMMFSDDFNFQTFNVQITVP